MNTDELRRQLRELVGELDEYEYLSPQWSLIRSLALRLRLSLELADPARKGVRKDELAEGDRGGTG